MLFNFINSRTPGRKCEYGLLHRNSGLYGASSTKSTREHRSSGVEYF